MTAPIDATTSLEELDHTPMCGIANHQGAPAAARHWIDQHRCIDFLACDTCLNRLMSKLRLWLGKDWKLECVHCGMVCGAIDDMITVRPL